MAKGLSNCNSHWSYKHKVLVEERPIISWSIMIFRDHFVYVPSQWENVSLKHDLSLGGCIYKMIPGHYMHNTAPIAVMHRSTLNSQLTPHILSSGVSLCTICQYIPCKFEKKKSIFLPREWCALVLSKQVKSALLCITSVVKHVYTNATKKSY